MKSWRSMLTTAIHERGETLSQIVACTLTDDELDVLFDEGFGFHAGKPFTAWTFDSVYFPCKYDGAEWVQGVSRNPDGQPTPHIGGGS